MIYTVTDIGLSDMIYTVTDIGLGDMIYIVTSDIYTVGAQSA